MTSFNDVLLLDKDENKNAYVHIVIEVDEISIANLLDELIVHRHEHGTLSRIHPVDIERVKIESALKVLKYRLDMLEK